MKQGQDRRWRLSWDWAQGQEALLYLALALALASVLSFPFETCQMGNAQKEVSGVPKLSAVNQGILQHLMRNYP